MRRGAVPLFVIGTLAACGPPHIAPFTPRSRQYNQGKYAAAQADARPTTGSLFSEASPPFLQDTRVARVGDTVVVNINETPNAQGGTSTQLSKQSSRSLGVNAMLGLVPALKRANPDVDPTNILNLMSQMSFQGAGTTGRNATLTGAVATRVTAAMPNGDLYIEGTKVVMINNEEYHLYISGLVRPADVAQDNTVSSSVIADAQIEFTGRGDLADTIDRGWLGKILDAINPF